MSLLCKRNILSEKQSLILLKFAKKWKFSSGQIYVTNVVK